MDVKLVRIGIEDAEKLWNMQVTAFKELYDRYQDTETSPATEPVDKIVMRLKQPFTYYYFIIANSIEAGAIRVIDKHEYGITKRISPIFVMPEYRTRGLAQKAIKLVEEKTWSFWLGIRYHIGGKRQLLFIWENGIPSNRRV